MPCWRLVDELQCKCLSGRGLSDESTPTITATVTQIQRLLTLRYAYQFIFVISILPLPLQIISYLYLRLEPPSGAFITLVRLSLSTFLSVFVPVRLCPCIFIRSLRLPEDRKSIEYICRYAIWMYALDVAELE